MKLPSSRTWQAVILVLVVLGVLFLALSGYLSPVFGVASSPFVQIQSWISSRYMALYEFVTVPREMEQLQARNMELESEIANLQTQIIELQQQLREADVLYALLDFARTNPESRYVAAAVIGKDPKIGRASCRERV